MAERTSEGVGTQYNWQSVPPWRTKFQPDTICWLRYGKGLPWPVRISRLSEAPDQLIKQHSSAHRRRVAAKRWEYEWPVVAFFFGERTWACLGPRQPAPLDFFEHLPQVVDAWLDGKQVVKEQKQFWLGGLLNAVATVVALGNGIPPEVADALVLAGLPPVVDESAVAAARMGISLARRTAARRLSLAKQPNTSSKPTVPSISLINALMLHHFGIDGTPLPALADSADGHGHDDPVLARDRSTARTATGQAASQSDAAHRNPSSQAKSAASRRDIAAEPGVEVAAAPSPTANHSLGQPNAHAHAVSVSDAASILSLARASSSSSSSALHGSARSSSDKQSTGRASALQSKGRKPRLPATASASGHTHGRPQQEQAHKPVFLTRAGLRSAVDAMRSSLDAPAAAGHEEALAAMTKSAEALRLYSWTRQRMAMSKRHWEGAADRAFDQVCRLPMQGLSMPGVLAGSVLPTSRSMVLLGSIAREHQSGAGNAGVQHDKWTGSVAMSDVPVIRPDGPASDWDSGNASGSGSASGSGTVRKLTNGTAGHAAQRRRAQSGQESESKPVVSAQQRQVGGMSTHLRSGLVAVPVLPSRGRSHGGWIGLRALPPPYPTPRAETSLLLLPVAGSVYQTNPILAGRRKIDPPFTALRGVVEQRVEPLARSTSKIPWGDHGIRHGDGLIQLWTKAFQAWLSIHDTPSPVVAKYAALGMAKFHRAAWFTSSHDAHLQLCSGTPNGIVKPIRMQGSGISHPAHVIIVQDPALVTIHQGDKLSISDRKLQRLSAADAHRLPVWAWGKVGGDIDTRGEKDREEGGIVVGIQASGSGSIEKDRHHCQQGGQVHRQAVIPAYAGVDADADADADKGADADEDEDVGPGLHEAAVVGASGVEARLAEFLIRPAPVIGSERMRGAAQAQARDTHVIGSRTRHGRTNLRTRKRPRQVNRAHVQSQASAMQVAGEEDMDDRSRDGDEGHDEEVDEDASTDCDNDGVSDRPEADGNGENHDQAALLEWHGGFIPAPHPQVHRTAAVIPGEASAALLDAWPLAAALQCDTTGNDTDKSRSNGSTHADTGSKHHHHHPDGPADDASDFGSGSAMLAQGPFSEAQLVRLQAQITATHRLVRGFPTGPGVVAPPNAHPDQEIESIVEEEAKQLRCEHGLPPLSQEAWQRATRFAFDLHADDVTVNPQEASAWKAAATQALQTRLALQAASKANGKEAQKGKGKGGGGEADGAQHAGASSPNGSSVHIGDRGRGIDKGTGRGRGKDKGIGRGRGRGRGTMTQRAASISGGDTADGDTSPSLDSDQEDKTSVAEDSPRASADPAPDADTLPNPTLGRPGAPNPWEHPLVQMHMQPKHKLWALARLGKALRRSKSRRDRLRQKLQQARHIGHASRMRVGTVILPDSLREQAGLMEADVVRDAASELTYPSSGVARLLKQSVQLPPHAVEAGVTWEDGTVRAVPPSVALFTPPDWMRTAAGGGEAESGSDMGMGDTEKSTAGGQSIYPSSSASAIGVGLDTSSYRWIESPLVVEQGPLDGVRFVAEALLARRGNDSESKTKAVDLNVWRVHDHSLSESMVLGSSSGALQDGDLVGDDDGDDEGGEGGGGAGSRGSHLDKGDGNDDDNDDDDDDGEDEGDDQDDDDVVRPKKDGARGTKPMQDEYEDTDHTRVEQASDATEVPVSDSGSGSGSGSTREADADGDGDGDGDDDGGAHIEGVEDTMRDLQTLVRISAGMSVRAARWRQETTPGSLGIVAPPEVLVPSA